MTCWRRREWPALRNVNRRSVRLLGEEDRPILELVRGGDATGGTIRALFNLGDQPARPPGGFDARETVLFRSEAAAYGGDRPEDGPDDDLAPFEFVVLGPSSWRAFPAGQ